MPVLVPKSAATFFETRQHFREWLVHNHQTATELFVGYYKVGSGKPSMTWSESVDQALCFGWIDGIRRSIDEESYCIRFTPRRKNSMWSEINIRKVEQLTKAGLMKPAGLKAFSFLKKDKSESYNLSGPTIEIHAEESRTLDPDYEQKFRSNINAWNSFMKQTPSYRKNVINWIMSAVKEETRLARLEKTIMESK